MRPLIQVCTIYKREQRSNGRDNQLYVKQLLKSRINALKRETVFEFTISFGSAFHGLTILLQKEYLAMSVGNLLHRSLKLCPIAPG